MERPVLQAERIPDAAVRLNAFFGVVLVCFAERANGRIGMGMKTVFARRLYPYGRLSRFM